MAFSTSIMKTLVIHPEDATTAFLSQIYEGRGWTVITNPRTSSKILKDAIKAHDRIIMLGHGSEDGLLTKVPFRALIDSDYVYLLREKSCVGIWCNADVFFTKYGLNGFYTGMIISEMDEALMYCLHEATSSQVNESNAMFATAITNAIMSESMLSDAKIGYKSEDNPIILFNQNNLFENIL